MEVLCCLHGLFSPVNPFLVGVLVFYIGCRCAHHPAPAVSAGTNLMLVASTSTHLAQMGALSPNGRSKTFDAAADGYGRGEACIVFVARRPADDGLAPLAVFHGEGVAAEHAAMSDSEQ